MTAKSLFW